MLNLFSLIGLISAAAIGIMSLIVGYNELQNSYLETISDVLKHGSLALVMISAPGIVELLFRSH